MRSTEVGWSRIRKQFRFTRYHQLELRTDPVGLTLQDWAGLHKKTWVSLPCAPHHFHYLCLSFIRATTAPPNDGALALQSALISSCLGRVRSGEIWGPQPWSEALPASDRPAIETSWSQVLCKHFHFKPLKFYVFLVNFFLEPHKSHKVLEQLVNLAIQMHVFQ